MANSTKNQPALSLLARDELTREMQEFLLDRRARNVSNNTITWYQQSLAIFERFVRSQGITTCEHVTPSILRRFLLHLQERGHNPGGVKNIYGAVKAFVRWYGDELASPQWRDPLRRVKSPIVPQQQQQPVSLDVLQALLSTCKRRTLAGDRDRAMLLALLDTGCRASEFLALNLEDVDLGTGSVFVRRGKGRKPRVTFIGARARQALVRYLRHRSDTTGPVSLWVTISGGRLTYAGLRQVLRRRSAQAGVKTPNIHSFRHAFALNALRNGVDLISLQRLLGHADLTVLRRYLAQTEDDLREAHHKASPVDRLKL